jgi:DMSO/TMAO reductase YedYZ molybdopterin-dependent catalytic subunit
MGIVSAGFAGRPRRADRRLPPGQYLTEDFPVLSAGPTPRVSLDSWELTVETESGGQRRWSWRELLALPAETVTVDPALRDQVVEAGHDLDGCVARRAAG